MRRILSVQNILSLSRAISLLLLTCLTLTSVYGQDGGFIKYVNPLMGTDSNSKLSNGNTYPAIALPWGMNFWTPQTNRMGHGWVYGYDDSKIQGFKQTHQPSPWINDYGQFSVFPLTGDLKITGEERASWFSHKAETAKPNFYKVYLADYDVTTEITPTERAAMFRFTFPENEQSYVLVDAFDRGSYVKIIPSENKIIGFTTRNSGGVPDNFKNYFVIVFDKSFTKSNVWSKDHIIEGKTELKDDHVGAALQFKTTKGEQIHARVASSFISYEQAERNLKELGADSFDQVKSKGADIWNKELSRIKVGGGSDDQIETFYSCLYRVLLFPRKFYEYDENGNVVHYSPYNGKVLPGYMFTDNGFWDTFRAVFPFFNLMYPSLNEKIQEGLANTYKESGFLPEWASPGHRNCMIGSNSATIIADAYLKGGRGYDSETLWEAVVKNSKNEGPLHSVGRYGVDYYNRLGYVPYNVGVNENVARTLEYSFADFCIYKFGKELGKPESEIEIFAKRAMNYKNVFDKESKLMRGKNEDGTFQSPFSPFKWGDAFTEGNSWHYTWSVFHDMQGLIDLMGGKKEFVNMLDSVFVVPPVFDESYYGQVIHEIREMQVMNMGNYAHGNQPIQHMIYLYNYAGQPWKTQYWVREVMNRLYTPQADGYCGDEDNGQTSAWYVFSAMGFYPVCPGSNEYVIGSPLFKSVKIELENGNQISIKADRNSMANRYIVKMDMNGEKYSKNYLSHDDLMKGAEINFQMGAIPNKNRGVKKKDSPYSFSNEK
ncbi:GH92 family glycosyl hydrolase [Labilibaculum euxinus]|uniref:Glycoside hydrolase family 92 protein n=1 Tax=Labilibaculum euxinus TaxID=2686357 RepID=A0A7M4D4J6_9BACT|nr:GH92 family glycosyl hydrolase [Labilibaculum euxinus]MUP37575.1 glycoside hydrolase family 92 protein [Labilibaculum euxinus]MVB06780.1 glycoside hydrolase family 92 protein [Labilibaculum euxinus]